ncbi:MAG: YggU family protein [Lentisphaerae bacterium]|nr:YggU family protein [Lentisphaerota bacterium]MBR2873744.1 YggU family protein [Lentisphaeria bacterium]
MPEDISQALSAAENGVYISLHIQPGAKREAVAGLFGTSLKIALNAPPVDGKANAALLRFLAGKLGVPKRQIELCSGASSRDKRVFVSGLTIEQVKKLLI